MRCYYLFTVKKEVYECYKKSVESLYKTLERLYNSPLENFNYGITIYYQLCNVIDVKRLSSYFEEKNFLKIKKIYEFKNNKTKEHTFIQITPSYIKIKTNKNISELFMIFLYYDSNIFVCDFKEKDYFWLKDSHMNSKVTYT